MFNCLSFVFYSASQTNRCAILWNRKRNAFVFNSVSLKNEWRSKQTLANSDCKWNTNTFVCLIKKIKKLQSYFYYPPYKLNKQTFLSLLGYCFVYLLRPLVNCCYNKTIPSTDQEGEKAKKLIKLTVWLLLLYYSFVLEWYAS